MSTFPPANEMRERFAGVLLGTAVGDALGLPAENLSPDKIRKRWKGVWQMRLLFGRGMISDDTEHTLMVAQALLENPANVDGFQKCLRAKLRWWFVGLPGGVGMATARACIKMWLGFSIEKCGVKSGGSGPAMRSAILGAYFASSPEQRRAFVLASARLTHHGWQAETAALAVAECAALVISHPGLKAVDVLDRLAGLSSEKEWQAVWLKLKSSLAAGDSTSALATGLGLGRGVSGYALHVVPVAVYAWLRHPDDFRAALVSAFDCGGDTDTVGAVLGALTGANVGKGGIPAEWLDAVWEFPRSIDIMEQIAIRLAEQQSSGQRTGPVNYFWPAILPRNIIFLLAVLAHGFRRLLPPY